MEDENEERRWIFEIDENGILWTEEELQVKESQRQHARMCKSQFDEYLKVGFSRVEALSLIETQMMGGNK